MSHTANPATGIVMTDKEGHFKLVPQQVAYNTMVRENLTIPKQTEERIQRIKASLAVYGD